MGADPAVAYGPDGSFLSGTFADYLLPTVAEVPEPLILHMQTPSPFTPLGSKGVGEGNCMSTPVCIANAVADALGVPDIELPLLPARLAEAAFGAADTHASLAIARAVQPARIARLKRAEARRLWGREGSDRRATERDPSAKEALRTGRLYGGASDRYLNRTTRGSEHLA